MLPVNVCQYDQALTLLPVLDLIEGQVVAARAGERGRYAPIRTPLTAGSDPVAVLGALLARSGADRAYLADLDGIQHGRPQWAVLRRLLAAFPQSGFWLDAGFASLEAGREAAAGLDAQGGRVVPVLGSETLQGCSDLSRTADTGPCVLSLDFGSEGFRGDPAWLAAPQCWPQQVIVMTLARVGVAQGPDLDRLRACLALAGDRQLYAAGGVRHVQDLAALARLGVAGALVASALHSGALRAGTPPPAD